MYEISSLLYKFIYTGTIDDVNTSTPFPGCGLSSPSPFSSSSQSQPLETGTDITIILYLIAATEGLLRMFPQLEYTHHKGAFGRQHAILLHPRDSLFRMYSQDDGGDDNYNLNYVP